MADPLANWKKLLKNLAEAADYEVKVGYQGETGNQNHEQLAAAKAGRTPGKSELTIAEVAAVHEFNDPSDTPPGRPHIRPPMYEKEDYWRNRLAQLLHDIIEKGGNLKQAYRQVGEEYRKAIIDRVNAGIAPDLAESTIAARNRRGGSKKGAVDVTPLRDTGAMIGALSVEVVSKK